MRKPAASRSTAANPSTREKRAGANAAARARRYRESIVKKLISEKQCSEYEARELVRVAGAIDAEPDFLLQMNDCSPMSVGSAFRDVVAKQHSNVELEDIAPEEYIESRALALMVSSQSYLWHPGARHSMVVGGLKRSADPYGDVTRILLSRYTNRELALLEELINKSSRSMGKDMAMAFAIATAALLSERNDTYALESIVKAVPKDAPAARIQAIVAVGISNVYFGRSGEQRIPFVVGRLREYMKKFGHHLFNGRDLSAEQIEAIYLGKRAK